jgi:hypothetical protein
MNPSSETIWESGSVAAGLVAIVAIAGTLLLTLPPNNTRMASKGFEIENVMLRSSTNFLSETIVQK